MLTRHHIVLLTIAVLSLGTYATSAGAQDQGKRPETTGSASGSSGVPPAPVGHRQPRASDIPADTQPTGQEETQIQRDRELDKKLWICRGCGLPP